MFCIIDNYDSFTYNLVEYMRILGHDVEVFKNDVLFDSINFQRYLGIILSPGPSSPQNSGITLPIIEKVSNIPIFGVCLGMQAIGYVYGGAIVHAKNIMHGKTDTIEHYGGKLFENIPHRFTAVRYHSLVVSQENFPSCLTIEARSSDGEIMALSHKTKFIWGVQFHPESYASEYGLQILKNFIGGCYEYRSAYSSHN
ncbi:MAG: aminodeoxychorismate/anthranilate synthase component II [Spirochaetes bacterium]|nr:aminodeoxychorismate/anthranilate synthase component II [Spirochaetota bacterium]